MDPEFGGRLPARPAPARAKRSPPIYKVAEKVAQLLASSNLAEDDRQAAPELQQRVEELRQFRELPRPGLPPSPPKA